MNAPLDLPTAADSLQRWVSFGIDSRQFGLEVLGVQEVLCPPRLAPVPGAPPECLGVINLRGRIIPVLDLRRLLGVADAPDSESTRFIVIDDGDEAVALRVDRVGEVLSLPAAAIAEPPNVGSLSPDLLQGVHRRDDSLLVLLDAAALVRQADSRIAAAGR